MDECGCAPIQLFTETGGGGTEHAQHCTQETVTEGPCVETWQM